MNIIQKIYYFVFSLIELLLNVGPALEVDHGVGVVHRRVLDLVLLRQVVEGGDGGLQPGHRQEGGQVGRVGRDDDEAEEPPGPNVIKLSEVVIC